MQSVHLRRLALVLAISLVYALPALGFATESESDPWVARKGGSVVTLKDIDAQLEGLPSEVRAGMMADPRRVEKLIEDLLLNRQLADMARAKGLDGNPLHAQKLRLAEDRFLSQEFIQSVQHDMDAQQLELLARERYMLSSPATYGGTDEKRDLQHILIAYDGRSAVEAKTLAEDVHAKLMRGEAFDQLAMTYSADKARVDDLGLPKPPGLLMGIGRGETDPDFEQVAFAIKRVGEITAPVQTTHGFHIIKLLRIQEEKRLPFEEVKHIAIAEASKWLERKKRDDLVDNTRSLPVEGNPDVIASLRSRYTQPDQESAE